MKNRALIRLLAATLFATFALAAHAQANTFDVSAGGGVTDYFGSGSANRAKGMFEAAATYNFASYFGAGFEYAYSPVDSYSTTYNTFGGSFNQSGSDHLQHFGGVVHVPFAITTHAEPFVAGHFGAIHETANATASGSGGTQTASQTANGGYFGVGVGANLFVYRKFGFRPELRYEYLTESGSHLHEMDFTVSAFYRFGAHK